MRVGESFVSYAFGRAREFERQFCGQQLLFFFPAGSNIKENNIASDSETKNNRKDNVKAFLRKRSHEELFVLIDLYEARPCLRDVSSKKYHNREMTAKEHKH